MKNISFFCLLFCLTILGCDKEKSGTPKSGNDYYMFSITIDGVTHKVEGNYGNNFYAAAPYVGNYCYSNISSVGASVGAGMGDKGATSYISGEVFVFALNLSNLSLGSNDAYGAHSNQANNLNWPETSSSCGSFSLSGNFFTGVEGSASFELDNVIITDLGTPGIYNPGNISNLYTYGDPVIGSFSGTVYGCSTSTSGYDIPVQLEIEFVAPRLYN